MKNFKSKLFTFLKKPIFFSFLIKIPRNGVLLFIRLYQKTLSFDHSPFKALYPHGYCRFYPTCSEYGYKSIKIYGIIKGTSMTLKRITRCNPWNEGGIDKVPVKKDMN